MRVVNIVLASSNAGKISEFQAMMEMLPITLLPQSELGIGDAEETASTFVENALIKARHAAALSGLPAIADDSGLLVDALDGRPGIFSARYASDNQSRIDKLLEELDGVPDKQRTASFYCMTVFVKHATDSAPLLCEGRWQGRILTVPAGKYGFGYDPIFYDMDYQCSAAQLPSDVKNSRSHRGQALRHLVSELSRVYS